MKCAKEKFKNHVNNIEKIPWRKKRREWSWCFQNIFPTKWSLVNVQQKENTGKGNEKKWGGEKRKDKSWVAMHSGLIFTGLLIFRAVAEPRNSGKSAKFTKTRKILLNSVEIVSNTCLYSNFETCLSYWRYLLAVNSQIYVKPSSLKRGNNVPKLPGVDYVAKNWALAMMLSLFHWFISRAYCCWKSKWWCLLEKH